MRVALSVPNSGSALPAHPPKLTILTLINYSTLYVL